MIDSIFPLKECELFKDLNDEELSQVAIICSEIEKEEGAPLFTEGQPADRIYVVTRGTIALHKTFGVSSRRNFGRSATVAFCSQDHIVGWSALVEPYKYTLSATAWERSALLEISANLLRRAIELNPRVGFRVMRCLSEVMARRLQQVVEALTAARDTTGPGGIRL